MRRLLEKRGGPLAGAVLLLCACSPAANNDVSADNDSNNAAAEKFVNRMAGAPEAAPISKPFAHSEKSALLEFVYAWPAEASAVSQLATQFRKEMVVEKADALKMAKQDQEAAQQSGFPFHAHSLEKRWTVTADTPRFLALQSSTYSYTGGAHGMTGYNTLLWDKARQRETSLEAIMTSPAAFATAIHDRFCDGLDKARAKKRGAPVPRGDDPFTKCIDPMKEVLALTSKDGKLVDGVTVVIGPYSAGSYAEGTYEVPLSVDEVMRKAIKTEYQDAFVSGS